MFVDFDLHPHGPDGTRTVAAQSQWSILLPFFNEREFIVDTLEGLARQSVASRLILIDNASTDGGAEIAMSACRRLGLQVELVVERQPGKVAALAAGLARVATPYVATCDADTWYPPHYLAEAEVLLAQGHAVAGAFFVAEDDDAFEVRRRARRMAATAAVLRGQCHTGGAGQAFRTEVLRKAGGFDAARWGWVLEDHEVIHRVMRHGTMGYARHLWCCPASRPRDRASIRWTLAERLLYCVAAPVAGDWFFYRFLASRFKSRRLTSERIRERQFHDVGRNIGTAPHPVCG